MDDTRNSVSHGRTAKTKEQALDIHRKIKEVNQTELNEKYQEIEVLQNTFDEFNVHRKVRKLQESPKRKTWEKLVNDARELIVDREDTKETWKKSLEELFFDERGDPSHIQRDEVKTVRTKYIRNPRASWRWVHQIPDCHF